MALCTASRGGRVSQMIRGGCRMLCIRDVDVAQGDAYMQRSDLDIDEKVLLPA
jgi:hypothetical protein